MSYSNLFEMLKDILTYVEGHPGCVILSKDNPLSRKIGFCVLPANSWHVCIRNFLSRWINFLEVSPEVLWEIGLPKLKASFLTSESILIRSKATEYLSSSSGRIKLALSLTAGVNPLV